jgi:hypothetical protein
MKTTSQRLKPDSCEMHQHKTNRLIPDSRQTQNSLDPIIASFVFLATKVATGQYQNVIVKFPHRTNDVLRRTCDGCWLLN